MSAYTDNAKRERIKKRIMAGSDGVVPVNGLPVKRNDWPRSTRRLAVGTRGRRLRSKDPCQSGRSKTGARLTALSRKARSGTCPTRLGRT